MKKTFSKFLATAAAVSMLASVSVVANADATFETTTNDAGVIITGVNGADDLDTIAIPAEIDGKAVVGIADYAFADLDNLATIDTTAATSLNPEYVGKVAFMNKASLTDYIKTVMGEEATKDSVLTYIANSVYGEKEWTAEELAEVEAKVNAKAALAGVTLTAEMTEAELIEAVAVMLQNEDAMNLTATTTDKLAIWEATVTHDEVVVVVAEDSPIADIVANLPVSKLAGDANNDGIINVRDAAAIAAALANGTVEELPGDGNYNGDDVVNVRDAAAIAAALANGTI